MTSFDRSQLLQEGFDDAGTRLMPPFFGALPYPLPASHYRDTTNLTFTYDSDGDALAALLPPRFQLAEPKLIVSLINNRRVDWLAGGAYNLLAINVPVIFDGRDGPITGVFGLVVWENRTAPILMGRDVQGVPKLYAKVDDLREFPDAIYSATAHLDGARFARVVMEAAHPLGDAELEAVRQEQGTTNWFGWRHFPNVGAPGAAISHPVLFPQEFDIREATIGKASVEWTVPDWASNPTQLPIIDALARLPNLGGGDAILMRCENILRADLAHIPV
ncbi:acetoacetate decarboxylase family protein [Sphingopyxis sp. JAI128]|uniref:acetoacetate decarboxylase family protein n=1 Tax=Sphingopyxis sp. JAI128 TaxID=2723066 RepID=UPI00160C1955|nr:acetoacetate decarboxylase family protein [Sphingopyxis sp. JAI128]MBB6427012.1 acetoacetate decarboxylase [Sphingopyxis sp. JAI128]